MAQPAQSTIGPSSADMSLQVNAAVALGRLEPGAEHVIARGLGHAAQQIVVHATHEVALFLDERIERAIGEPDVGAVDAGLVALLAEHDERDVENSPPARSFAGEVPHSIAEATSSCRGEPGEGVGHVCAGADCLVDRAGEEPGGEVIAAGRETHGQLTVRSPVQLRRSSGAGSPALRQAAVLRRQQPVGNEPVEVKGGYGPAHSRRRGGLILADRSVPADDESVQRPALWFGQ